MPVTYEFTERICFENSADQRLFHDALIRIKYNPQSVNLSEGDFTPEAFEFIEYLIDITQRSSFFCLDCQEHVDWLLEIIIKVNNRRKKAGFTKCDFDKNTLRVLSEMYNPLPKE